MKVFRSFDIPNNYLDAVIAVGNFDGLHLGHQKVILEAKGRHDPCVVPRAIPIIESMSALVILNMLLHQKIRN